MIQFSYNFVSSLFLLGIHLGNETKISGILTLTIYIFMFVIYFSHNPTAILNRLKFELRYCSEDRQLPFSWGFVIFH